MTQSFEVDTINQNFPQELGAITRTVEPLAAVIQLSFEPEGKQMDTAQQVAYLNALYHEGKLSQENRVVTLRGIAREIRRSRVVANRQRHSAVHDLEHIKWED